MPFSAAIIHENLAWKRGSTRTYIVFTFIYNLCPMPCIECLWDWYLVWFYFNVLWMNDTYSISNEQWLSNEKRDNTHTHTSTCNHQKCKRYAVAFLFVFAKFDCEIEVFFSFARVCVGGWCSKVHWNFVWANTLNECEIVWKFWWFVRLLYITWIAKWIIHAFTGPVLWFTCTTQSSVSFSAIAIIYRH